MIRHLGVIRDGNHEWPTHFVVNRTAALMPSDPVVRDYAYAWSRTGRPITAFEWSKACIEIARQRLLLEYLRRKHGAAQ